MMKNWRVAFVAAALAVTGALGVSPALAQVAEAQQLLNALRLEAGTPDGQLTPATLKAWQAFLEHRGLPADTPLDAAGLAELKGQSGIELPEIKGATPTIAAGRFPSKDSYARDPDDPTGFSLTLKKGDYDPVDYSAETDPLVATYGYSLKKQRAELALPPLKADQPYTFDFEVNLDNPFTGSIFQVHSGNAVGTAYMVPDQDIIRFSAGEHIQNLTIYKGDWLGKWHNVRVVFMCSSGGDSWFRFYFDGTMTLDTKGQDTVFPMADCGINVGLYRGTLGSKTTVKYRHLALSDGDLGAPKP